MTNEELYDFTFIALYFANNPMQKALTVCFKSNPIDQSGNLNLPTITGFYLKEVLKPDDVAMVNRLLNVARENRKTNSTSPLDLTSHSHAVMDSTGIKADAPGADSSGTVVNESWRHWIGH